MSLLEGLTDDQKNVIALRLFIEEFGRRLLELQVCCSCGELVISEIIQKCAKSKRWVTLNTGKMQKDIRLYIYEVQKAKECLENPILSSFSVSFLNKFLVLSDSCEITEELKNIVKKTNQLFHYTNKSSQQDCRNDFNQLKLILGGAVKEVRYNATNHLKSVMKAEKAKEMSKALQDLDALELELNNFDKPKDINIDVTYRLPERYMDIVGREVLMNYYDKLITYSSLSFPFEIKCQVKVDQIYTPSQFTLKNKHKEISLEEIYKKVAKPQENLIIEGPSGVGKSTFIRNLLAIKRRNALLQDFLVVPFDCRSDRSSLNEVISDIFPDATKQFNSSDLISAIISLNPLFLIDGLDQRNDKSKNVVSEIISQMRENELGKFVVTSTPGDDLEDYFNQSGRSNNNCYIEIKGISDKNVDLIIKNYCQHFSSRQSIESKVIDVYNRILPKRTTPPLVICLVSYLLLCIDTGNIEFKSITQLYEAFFESLYNKLRTKLSQQYPDCYFANGSFESNLKLYRRKLCEFSYNSLKYRQDIFSLEDVFVDSEERELKEKVLSAFLLSETLFSKIGAGKKLNYRFPHRSFKEFLAAKYIVEINNTDHSLMDAITGPGLPELSVYDFLAFVLGILSSTKKLTQQLSDEIIPLWGNNVNKNTRSIILEGNQAPEIVGTLSRLTTELVIERDHRLLNLLLEKPCPKLKWVLVLAYFRYVNEDVMNSLRLLKDKNVKLTLILDPSLDSQPFLKRIDGGKCTLEFFTGRLTQGALKVLSEVGELLIQTKEDLECFDFLASRTRDEENALHVQTITLVIQDDWDLTVPLKRLPYAVNGLVVKCPEGKASSHKRVLMIHKWLSEAENKEPLVNVIFQIHEEAEVDVDHLQQTMQKDFSHRITVKKTVNVFPANANELESPIKEVRRKAKQNKILNFFQKIGQRRKFSH